MPIKRSVQPDYIVCLEDGAKVKMLKRYLAARFSLTPEAYRTKWGLSRDYPMVAPAYAAKRSALSKPKLLGHFPAGENPGGKRAVRAGRKRLTTLPM